MVPMSEISSLLNKVSCPLCGANKGDHIYQKKINIGDKYGVIPVTVTQCCECGFAFNSPRPDSSVYDDYYSSSSMVSGAVFRLADAGSSYGQLYAERAKFVTVQIASAGRGGRFLDVGCGNGDLLAYLRDGFRDEQENWRIEGLDPSAKSCASARKKGFSVWQGTTSNRPADLSNFDGISMNSVLEHLLDPGECLDDLFDMLADNGSLFVEVPNCLHPKVSLTGFFGFEHVNHFTPSSLYQMLDKHGFRDIERDHSASQRMIRVVARKGSVTELGVADDRSALRLAVKEYQREEATLMSYLHDNLFPLLEKWKAQGHRVGIYGAGNHTVELSAHFDLRDLAVCIIDGDQSKQGERLLGLPICAPEEIESLGLHSILISSGRFCEEITDTIRKNTKGQAKESPIEIVSCYQAPVPTIFR